MTTKTGPFITVNVRQTRTVNDHLVLAEASRLGIDLKQPWPSCIVVVDDQNEGFVFIKTKPMKDGGWRYVSRARRIALEVSNN